MNHVISVGGLVHCDPIQVMTFYDLCHYRHLQQTDRESCLHSVRILLQHLCVKVPDKADYRSKVAEVGLDQRYPLQLLAHAEFQLINFFY